MRWSIMQCKGCNMYAARINSSDNIDIVIFLILVAI